MAEIGRFFEENSEVHRSLRRLTQRLEKMGLDYAICGGMAIARHGHYRTTDDVDLLVTPVGLKQIHEELDGLGYVPKFRGSKHLRDVSNGVAIEFLESGQYPGDGKPKPVVFPDPADVFFVKDGVRYLDLETLIQLKLASGMSAEHRGKDLVDVQSLVTANSLERSFAERLDPYVRDAFLKCWRNAQTNYARILLLEEPSDADLVGAMRTAGVEVVERERDGTRQALATTTDASLARRFDMHPAEDFLDPPV